MRKRAAGSWRLGNQAIGQSGAEEPRDESRERKLAGCSWQLALGNWAIGRLGNWGMRGAKSKAQSGKRRRQPAARTCREVKWSKTRVKYSTTNKVKRPNIMSSWF